MEQREWADVRHSHGRGANLLMYNTEQVSPAPDSWSAVFDVGAAQKGKVTAYDSPIYFADAALYLMATKPDLGIKDPYALDATQLQAAVIPALGPAVAAGTIFTFSLSLGDYIAVTIVGGKLQMLGTAVYQNITLDQPFAAALGTASVVIMVVYLLAVRRTGALDNL